MNKQSSYIEAKRHSLSHILAMAVTQMYPDTILGIGPTIENGFYYDFELKSPLSPEDLPKIEKKMREIMKKDIAFERSEKTIKEALIFVKSSNQPYKEELVKDLSEKGEKTVSFYKSGDFSDLCAGPHIKNSRELDHDVFKLMSVAGAYWKGSEKNKMLTRIYAVAFETKRELDEYLVLLEEAKKRDHKKLGPELGLFMFHETAPGLPYWLPKGLTIFNELVNFWRVEHESRDYQEIRSPLINKKELYETSGHWDHYKEDMFICETDEDETYALKPMNCPNAMIVYASQTRSYRDLPLRLSDTDTLHRNEISGALNGLLRARSFSQDDAHIFVTEDQIKAEYGRVFEIIERFYSIFNLEYSFRLGTRPEKYMGEPKVWDKAEKELQDILKDSGKKYFVLEGDGAFYGPKIDIIMKDSLGREWQMGTIQLDFQIPKNFDLKYKSSDGTQKTPVVIHRVIYGSIERFMGIITEHFAGDFPLWLAPIHVRILPVADRHLEAAKKLKINLSNEGLRIEIDETTESVGKKIRNAEISKAPYMIVFGDKEADSGKLSVRSRKDGSLDDLSTGDLVKKLKKEISGKL